MNIKFTDLKLYGFLSFGEAEVDLSDRGYVLVSGINKNPKDLATSNGSGKSGIWSAISYALFGETIQGLSSNIPNINLNDGCYVELTFYIDNDKYHIIRYRDYRKIGTDLKIYVNGEDKSGKGIRESQALLKEYIPDLTLDLLGSVIILGQSLPHKFSNNSPSGRKEILEKLSKSDFMIEDIKERVASRSVDLSRRVREYSDSILKEQTAIKINTSSLEADKRSLDELATIDDIDTKLITSTQELEELEKAVSFFQNQIDINSKELEQVNEERFEISTDKAEAISDIDDQEKEALLGTQTLIQEINNKVITLKDTIKKLTDIVDVCPTCLQRIVGVDKPDPSKFQEELREANAKLLELNEIVNNKKREFENQRDNISKTFDDTLIQLNNSIAQINNAMSADKRTLALKNSSIQETQMNIQRLQIERENLVSTEENLKRKILELETKIEESGSEIKELNSRKDNLEERIKIIDKINTLIKRDFRGYLLTNVVDYINLKSKEYSNQIFATDDIAIKVNGNNIQISFCDKMYENLSGGEKQKVDLIIQFAIRDMLSQYLNFSTNILVLDEILDNLDATGSERVLNFISNHLPDVESIFFITHRNNELSLPYDSEIIVEKSPEGISTISTR